MEHIGVYLREKRVESGLTQVEVSEKLGLTTSQFISNFERGLCDPSWEALRKLVKLYSISEREIVDVLLAHRRKFIVSRLRGPSKKAKAK